MFIKLCLDEEWRLEDTIAVGTQEDFEMSENYFVQNLLAWEPSEVVN